MVDSVDAALIRLLLSLDSITTGIKLSAWVTHDKLPGPWRFTSVKAKTSCAVSGYRFIALQAENKTLRLNPGMAVTVEVKTSKRRVMSIS